MKKILLSCAVIVVFAGYAIYQNTHSAPATAQNQTSTAQNAPAWTDSTAGSSPPAIAGQSAKATTTSNSTATTAPTPAPAPAPVVAQTPTPTPAPVIQQPVGQFKNGTYTGQAADAFYGTVQVAAVISGGKLTDIQILQYPSDRSHSFQLSQMALPQLRSEAIAAQSASVQIISGATDTSQAFGQSLHSALGQAKA
jgi:uncharacterized protein with FMN-binding domain